ncbi:hypothetical protein D7Z26_12610 [Cohnella endophytica]|uniref:Hydrolase n=1 Tax=Cohnella endophytica TaxID=2419778 RepID=A0A494Y199_9BACL|nr:hypothetical protein [Cohnella endophytica]RKP54207.1 hypothetical protein D7Z26_12610 [Cohnella endophytica]
MEHNDREDSNRKTYYVAVGARQVLEDREAAAFEFAIQANDDEVHQLQELFEEIQDSDEDNAFHFSGNPMVSDDPEDETFIALLQDIYGMLYRLGTPETKKHIEDMNILQ